MARYAFPVRLSHPLLNAGLSRRSKLKHAPPGGACFRGTCKINPRSRHARVPDPVRRLVAASDVTESMQIEICAQISLPRDTPTPFIPDRDVGLPFRRLSRDRGSLHFLRFAPAQDLIHRERQNPKHKMRHHFGPSAHPHKPPSEFIFQPREDTFHRGALAKTDPLMGSITGAGSEPSFRRGMMGMWPKLTLCSRIWSAS